MTEIHERLQELKELGLYRRMRMISGPQGPRVVLDGKPVLLLCSNNYLGLADHPRVREAYAKTIAACRQRGKHCGVGGLATGAGSVMAAALAVSMSSRRQAIADGVGTASCESSSTSHSPRCSR